MDFSKAIRQTSLVLWQCLCLGQGLFRPLVIWVGLDHRLQLLDSFLALALSEEKSNQAPAVGEGVGLEFYRRPVLLLGLLRLFLKDQRHRQRVVSRREFRL